MTNNAYRVSYDEYPTCEKCGRRWQLLDYSCALHRLTCGDVSVSLPEQLRITQNAAERGVSVLWVS